MFGDQKGRLESVLGAERSLRCWILASTGMTEGGVATDQRMQFGYSAITE